MYSPDGKELSRWGLTEELKTPLINSWGYSDWIPPEDPITWALQDVVDLLLEQFDDKPNICNLVKIFANNLLQIENIMIPMFQCRNLDVAYGDRLDIAGEIIGVERNGINDDEYRNLIKLQIFLNNSSGEPEALIAALKLFAKATKVHYKELYPAKVLMEFVASIPPPTNILANMQKIAMGGVKVILSWSIDDNYSFSFDGEDGLLPDPDTLGFSEEDFPLEGGSFVEKI